MKPLCRELERLVESGVERLPDALQAHLTGCAKCQRVWRLHRAYQRALHAARRELTPACELPWTRVQAQLAARAVSRRPLAWLRPALGWGMAVAVALAVGAALLPWGNQQPSQGETLAQAHRSKPRALDTPPKADTTRDAAGAVSIEVQGVAPARVDLRAPAARIVAQATPHLRDSVSLHLPTPETLQSDADAIRHRRDVIIESRRSDEAAGAPALGSAPAPPFTVASLPLTPFGVSDQAASVEYLPISYGSPSSYYEGSNNEAIIGSF